MSILPSFKAELKEGVSQERSEAIVKDVSKMKGVLSVAFNAESASMNVTYMFGNDIEAEVRKIPEVKKIEPLL